MCESVQSDNLGVCSPVDVYACVRLCVEVGDRTGDDEILPVCYLAPASASTNVCVCVCVSISYVHQSKVTVLADA